jgi:hypothetical protein
VTWRSAALLAAMALVLAAGPAGAQQQVRVEVLVSEISDGPGGIDARGGKLHSKLKDQFRYESLKVLDARELRLALDQVGSLGLPNGRPLRVRPLQIDERSVLLAVDVEGAVRTDLRVQNGNLVVIGAGHHGDGKLVISFEPHW